jgi:hypothetical protein
MTNQQTLEIDLTGQTVKVLGVRGTFIVQGLNKDGSLAVYGGTKNRERHRSFTRDRVKFERAKR